MIESFDDPIHQPGHADRAADLRENALCARRLRPTLQDPPHAPLYPLSGVRHAASDFHVRTRTFRSAKPIRKNLTVINSKESAGLCIRKSLNLLPPCPCRQQSTLPRPGQRTRPIRISLVLAWQGVVPRLRRRPSLGSPSTADNDRVPPGQAKYRRMDIPSKSLVSAGLRQAVIASVRAAACHCSPPLAGRRRRKNA